MGQSCGHPPADSLDTVITNAVIIDYSGIFKADIGIKDGFIVSLGKAGNPDIMDGVFSNIIGVNAILTVQIVLMVQLPTILIAHTHPFSIIRLTLRLLREKE